MKNFSIAAIFLAVLGVAVPIAWDYYKSTSAIDVEVTGRSTIISKPEQMDSLVITYDGEVLNELSKTTFSIINSGRTPILKKDIASPISVRFINKTSIIDAKLDGMQPQDLGATLHFNKGDGLIILEFPLMNPGDKIDFSVLAKTSDVQFDVTGRIAGISTLAIKNTSHDEVSKSRSWAIYLVGFFSALLGLVAVVALFTFYPAEKLAKAQIKSGTFELPTLKTKDDWISWTNSAFSFTTVKERAPLHALIRSLPDAEDLAISHRSELLNGIQNLLHSAVSNLFVALIVLIFSIAGGWYVISNM